MQLKETVFVNVIFDFITLSLDLMSTFLCLWGVAGSSEEGVLNACGIQSLFSMCPGCWKAAESSNRDSLPHALHGKNSEIKGFV